MKKTINEKVAVSPPAKPAPPRKAKLTNKAGAFATPLERDVKDWLKIGWFRA